MNATAETSDTSDTSDTSSTVHSTGREFPPIVQIAAAEIGAMPLAMFEGIESSPLTAP